MEVLFFLSSPYPPSLPLFFSLSLFFFIVIYFFILNINTLYLDENKIFFSCFILDYNESVDCVDQNINKNKTDTGKDDCDYFKLGMTHIPFYGVVPYYYYQIL